MNVIIHLAGPKHNQIVELLPKPLGAAFPYFTKNCLKEVMRRKDGRSAEQLVFSPNVKNDP
jgi:hypothetical protein